ncbi:MAG TPA: tetratricopeptide repeat protein [Chitinophagaceae bacterium]|nr:tetratricopeptide repeat protein [Chitinophagaceae bacterium]
MSDKKQVQETDSSQVVIAKAKDFWTRNSKIILGVGVVLLLAVGGFWGYRQFIKNPKEEKAADAMFKAEAYFRSDSVSLALNGDGQNLGFLKIIDKYSGTDAANLAHFYAGSCYIRLDDNANAVKHLKKFSTDAKQVQQRAYKLLGDAYADQGNGKEALSYYKKAARHFEADKNSAAEALFLAAYLADRVLKDQKEAIALYKEIKEKYPSTQQSYEADNYLAQLGVYNVK